MFFFLLSATDIQDSVPGYKSARKFAVFASLHSEEGRRSPGTLSCMSASKTNDVVWSQVKNANSMPLKRKTKFLWASHRKLQRLPLDFSPKMLQPNPFSPTDPTTDKETFRQYDDRHAVPMARDGAMVAHAWWHGRGRGRGHPDTSAPWRVPAGRARATAEAALGFPSLSDLVYTRRCGSIIIKSSSS